MLVFNTEHKLFTQNAPSMNRHCHCYSYAMLQYTLKSNYYEIQSLILHVNVMSDHTQVTP